MFGQKFMRPCAYLVVVWLLSIGLVTASAHAQENGKMVALVNGAIIFHSDLNDALARYYHPLGGAPITATETDAPATETGAVATETGAAATETAHDPQKVKAQLLENLIDRELLIQEAQRQDLTIGTARVLRRMERLPEQLRPKRTAAEASGTPADGKDSFFRYVHQGLLIERLLEKQLPKVASVSAKRARAYYDENPGLFMYPEEVHLRHILIQAPPDMADETRQQAYLKIQALEQQLAEGATFTVLAIDASQCPSRARGGDLGYLTRQQLYPSLAQTAFDLVPGQVSTIVESPAGYHLLLVTDRRPARQLSFLMVRDDLQKQLRTQRLHRSARKFIRKLREEAAIERLLR